jgi:hypothetical protein
VKLLIESPEQRSARLYRCFAYGWTLSERRLYLEDRIKELTELLIDSDDSVTIKIRISGYEIDLKVVLNLI